MGVFLNKITWDVACFQCLVLICCLQSKGTRMSSRKQDDFVGFRSIRSSTSGRWLEKSGKHVGPNFTLKPNTKASSLQFCKTEIKTDIGGEKKRNKWRIYGLLVNGRDLRITQNRSSRERVKDSFTRLIHSCQCHFIHIYVYMYVCIYNFLWMILIPSLWSELLEVRWQSLAKIFWFLCHCEIK